MLVVNHPELFKPTDQRYLMNRLRETLPFSEVPIRLVFSERRRVDLSELKAGGRPRGRDDGARAAERHGD